MVVIKSNKHVENNAVIGLLLVRKISNLSAKQCFL
jgi:hypothetical protein